MTYYVWAYTEKYGGNTITLVGTDQDIMRQQYPTFERYPSDYVLREATIQEVDVSRISYGEWKQPVWLYEPFWVASQTAHIYPADPSLIEYRDERGRLVQMKPGRYLKRFHPELTDKQIAFYAEWWSSGRKPPRDMSDIELHFATTPDEIVEVYANGPSSCMQGMNCVRVYGAGDLAIAYLKEHGQIVARCLCWPEKKVFGRCYPNDGDVDIDEPEEVRDLLFQKMRSEGYQHVSEGGSFSGARLLKIPIGTDYVVMPYLDNGYSFKWGKDFLTMSYGEGNRATDTDGEAYCAMPTYHECAHCKVETDSFTRVSQVYLCDECFEDHTWVCNFAGTRVYGVEPVIMANGDRWSPERFEAHGFVDPTDGRNYPVWDGELFNNQLHHIQRAA